MKSYAAQVKLVLRRIVPEEILAGSEISGPVGAEGDYTHTHTQELLEF